MRAAGVIDLPTIQKYLNFWFSLTLDLFGGEVSSNAATFFAPASRAARGRQVRRRPRAARARPTACSQAKDGALVEKEVPMRNALNEVLRDEYVEDCRAASIAGTR